MKDFIGEPSNDGPIGAMEFGPALFKDHDPDLITPCGFGKEGLSLGCNRHIVINHHFPQHPLIQNPGHIDPILTDL